MFGYGTSIEHGVMQISINAKVIGRGTKMIGLYMLDDSTIIEHAPITSQDSHDSFEACDFELGHDCKMSLVDFLNKVF